MAQRYDPPKQGGGGQFFDSVFLMVLVFIALGAPVWLKAKPAEAPPAQEAAQAEQAKPPAVTWDDLKQSPLQRAQWEKLGHTPETAKPIIENRFDYTIDPMALIITALVIVVYFVFVFRWSDREYRQVLNERFGQGKS